MQLHSLTNLKSAGWERSRESCPGSSIREGTGAFHACSSFFSPYSSCLFCFFAGVTILLSLTVFHNIVTDTLPQVSDAMPLLGTLLTLRHSLYHDYYRLCWSVVDENKPWVNITGSPPTVLYTAATPSSSSSDVMYNFAPHTSPIKRSKTHN